MVEHLKDPAAIADDELGQEETSREEMSRDMTSLEMKGQEIAKKKKRNKKKNKKNKKGKAQPKKEGVAERKGVYWHVCGFVFVFGCPPPDCVILRPRLGTRDGSG